MIVYNMRYRGPYEYDKLILNVFQFYNEVLDIQNEIQNTTEKSLNSLSKGLTDLINKTEALDLEMSFLIEKGTKR